MSQPLDPLGNPVAVGRVILRTPGLVGNAEWLDPTDQAAMRGAEQFTEALRDALASEQMEAQESIQITGASELDVAGPASRSTSLGEPAIVAEVPDPGPDFGQVVLAIDEAGVATWNFPVDDGAAGDPTRGGATRTYVIRRHVPQVPDQGATRGLSSAVGTKLLKVLVFPIIDPLVGRAADYLAARWERSRRPYRVRSFTPDNYRDTEAAELTGEDWDRLAGGRALLLLHGTFSRAHAAFGTMPPAFVAELHRRYQGRVFAFDHFTMSDDPRRNAELFVEAIPGAMELELDIVCHSRGGLLARVLAEKATELPLGNRSLRVAEVVFVAGPNAGTVLADAKHLGDLVDRYTNLLNFFPDNGVTDVLEAVITVVKQLAVGAVKGLEGLQAMRPGGPFLRDWLNRSPKGHVRYRAIASDYEPDDPGLLAWAKDGLMDRIFGRAGNDLVVPTLGVYDRNGSGCFPIADRLVLTRGGIQHNGFFASAAVRDKLLDWLST
jgi:hypothetical protein